ncbi:MAG: quinone oxidoreductase [Hyphomonadaceae bacterium]|nr:quinone oxidoreductase [Hyphomonadaceae bacterium]
MKAIRIAEHGGPEVMSFDDVAEPAPGPNEIRVRHHAIGVNYIDTYHRSGLYKIPLPSGLGLEASGVVDALGKAVTRFKLGDRVAYCSGPIGAYAEANVLSEGRAVRLPDSIPFDIAAASLLKGVTARYLLHKTFRVEQGHWVLIHAAAGGVGQILVQWAKHHGANVIAAAGNEEKTDIAKRLGADYTIVIRGEEDFAPHVRAIVKEGVHVVYDGVGADTWRGSLDSLRPLGMMVSYGNASGPPPDINPLVLSQKGSLFLTRPTLFHHITTTEMLDETATDLFDVVTRGVVKIASPTRHALTDASRAHADLESRKTTGSLVLAP